MNFKKFLLILILFSLQLANLVYAQEHPPIQSYSPIDYGGENQNWAFSQSDDKYIYAANNKGLLEFNGAKWSLYTISDQSNVRSVAVLDNKVYTGSYREFGYWQRNDFGLLVYNTISKNLEVPFLDGEEIWKIIGIDDFILFQSLKRIYLYNKNEDSYSVINSDTNLYRIFKVDDSIYFQKTRDGVYEIVNGEAQLVSNHDIFKDNLVVNVFNHHNKLLFQTEDVGFYILQDGTLLKWEIPANDLLSKFRIYSSIKLKDDSFILGTVSNGVFHLTSEGNINRSINKTGGLSSNTVLALFEDVDHNIWLGLENGVDCLNIKSRFTIYNDKEGKIGAVNISMLSNKYLYIGTNQGLFYKEYGKDEAFTFIEGTKGAVWELTQINDTIFCGHHSGTFIIKDTVAKKIYDAEGTWNFKTIPNNPNLILQGNYSGLSILEYKNDVWSFRNNIEEFNISSRYLEFINDTNLLVSHENRGVFNLKFSNDYSRVLNTTKENSVKKGLKTSLAKYLGNIFYAHKDGVYKYDSIKNKFVLDSLYSQLYKTDEFTTGKLVSDTKSNKLWAFSESGLNYIYPRNLSDTPKISHIPLPSYLRNDISGYENNSHLENNRYLYGSATGYIIVDLNNQDNKSFKIGINTITVSSYHKSYRAEIVNKTKNGEFDNYKNNVKFNFSIPEYNKFLVAEYQYKLEGIFNEWSPWSTQPSKLYENLPHGNYTFYVRGRIGNQLTENTEQYSFTIEAPWYLSNLAIAFYIASILLFSLIMHNIYKQYYKKQREKLLLKTQRELELQELENRQQLMRFNNDKLKQDIDSKNRELGISTMSLIKKNEFLHSIKAELQNAQDSKNLKHIIKIIDRNLNNTDDWNTFEEAFNNADKDFLKKIKTLHPSLTSNDLRLCAYLRLNLSSKEIAPLLNISPRSVEVKRYRLRKKIGLSHESSLTHYILEI
ncbi:helix-turn-helix and ligand-binding sensor domain-containing protein [Changchengzhania lutea]|uniref:helix-turn-helix and ligand-binding sensor domain-containing protein n=1 Tax=Changchengzhania lutea TaxID=2049305 RepID=UPI001FEB3042|nr:LuxR C-terminal-related transcriptional regulator [Changchengzhania lutea]